MKWITRGVKVVVTVVAQTGLSFGETCTRVQSRETWTPIRFLVKSFVKALEGAVFITVGPCWWGDNEASPRQLKFYKVLLQFAQTNLRLTDTQCLSYTFLNKLQGSPSVCLLIIVSMPVILSLFGVREAINKCHDSICCSKKSILVDQIYVSLSSQKKAKSKSK